MRTAEHGQEGGRREGMKAVATVLAALVAVILCSCGDGSSLLPKSGGRPYEVLVVSMSGGMARPVADALSHDADGLPQSEPAFDVSVTDSLHFGETARLARNIVIVSVDSAQFTATRIRYEKNVWARPQMVVYVNAPSGAALLAEMPLVASRVEGLLTRAEMNVEISRLSESGNVKAASAINEMYGCSMKIPADMKSDKRGRDFIWLSDNAASGMQNICVYSYPGLSLVAERLLDVRDSVMKVNIPGERDGMYMCTVKESVKAGITRERGRAIMLVRGLWEMHGDAMGGPFVAVATVDSARQRIVVAEAFVYSPDTKKRNLIRQSEAALHTLKVGK